MRSLARLLLAAVLGCAACDARRGEGGAAQEAPGTVAVGKLVISPPALETALGSARDAGEAFIEQQLTLLRGDEIRKQAVAALKKSKPDLQPDPVVIVVARMTGSNVVSVSGRGGTPQANGALVDAIMEAYVAAVRPREVERDAAAVASSSEAEKGLREAERAWNTFRLEHDIAALQSNRAGAQRRLKRLEVARNYYEQELAMAAKLPLDQDLQRRQASPMLPQDMPAEFAALARSTLTVGELAYLSALKQTNAGATAAALKEATKDQGERVTSNRKQLEIVNDLLKSVQAEIAKLEGNEVEAAKLEVRLKTAEARYRQTKAHEKNVGAGPNNPVHPVVSIMERAGGAAEAGGR